MGLFDRAKRVAKANVRSALGRWWRGDRELDEAENELEEELSDARFDAPGRDEDLLRAYRRLELPFGAGKRRIEKAFRRLLAQYHPDRFGGDPDRAKLAEAVTKIITEARQTLLEAWRQGRIRNDRRK